MEFEFDPAKSQGNLAKHGIDFVTAQQVWADDERIDIAGRSVDEERRVVVGAIDDVLYAVVMTWRADKVRIISARRAHGIEVRLYEDRDR